MTSPEFEVVQFSMTDSDKPVIIESKPPTEEQLLIAAIASCSEELTTLKDSIATQQEKIANCEKESARIKREAESAMKKLATEAHELRESVFDVRQEIRLKEQELRKLETELKLLQEKLIRSKMFQEAAKEFDEITASMVWMTAAKKHQFDGARILALNKKVIEADDMGLGKSLTTLMACDMLQSQRLLIITPADLVMNFERECNKWAPHRATIPMYKMPVAQRDGLLKILALSDAPVTLLLNYEVWRKDNHLIKALVNLRFDTIICDEAHVMKDTSSSAYKGVHELVMSNNCCPTCSGAIEWIETGKYSRIEKCLKCDWQSDNGTKWTPEQRRSIKNVFPVTGTPILNRPQELFALLSLILPEVFAELRLFLELYCERDEYSGYWRFRNGGMKAMEHHLQGRYLRRSYGDAGVELPPQEETVHMLVMDPEEYPQQHKYMKMLSQHAAIILDSGKELTAMATIALITRKRQMNVWPAGIELKDEDGFVVMSVGEECQESIKIDKAMELILNNREGVRTVVFSQFKTGLKELEARLVARSISVARLDGDTRESDREIIKKDVDVSRTPVAKAKYQVILCNYKTGGVGLNMTGLTHTIILDEEWNGGKRDQAYRRTNRIGQTENTRVDILRLKGSIDDWLVNLVEFKDDVVAGFNQVGKSLSEELLKALRNGEIL